MRWVSPPRGTWARVAFRLLPLIAVLLCPWPGLASWFTRAFAAGCDALVGLDHGGHAEIRFDAAPADAEHPWWVMLSVKNVFTQESLHIPVDTRTVAYIRIAVFLSLALTWPVWSTRRGRRALAVGTSVLLSVIAFTIAVPLLQVLGIVHVLGLSVLFQSMLSVGILSLVTYPSMAFAVPGLIWAFTAWLARDEPAAAVAEAARGGGVTAR